MAADKKETVNMAKKEDELLMSQAEFEKKQRLVIKENINRVLRIAGLVAVLFLVAMAVPTLFNLSVFGLWIKGLDAYHAALGEFIPDAIRDYPLYMSWVSVVLLTLILMAVILGIVYLITYNIVDLVVFFKHIGSGFKGATEELRFTVKDTMSDELKSSKREEPKEKPVKTQKKEKMPKKQAVERRSEEKTDDLTGLSSEQLDALLRGDSINGSIPPAPEGSEEEPKKDLFAED